RRSREKRRPRTRSCRPAVGAPNCKRTGSSSVTASARLHAQPRLDVSIVVQAKGRHGGGRLATLGHDAASAARKELGEVGRWADGEFALQPLQDLLPLQSAAINQPVCRLELADRVGAEAVAA